ncbi:MAG: DUF1963 domain-containing protein [Ruminiclostridium sp.]|nr:DUF1963 domain-containing protein [Ruminiclostridium sp.]
MNYKNDIIKLKRNSIILSFEENGNTAVGATRFGGIPDVPKDFQWPYFSTSTFYDEEEKSRPLAFLAQFNCEEIAKYDTEHLLPDKGLLSFFYELDSQLWGFDPKNKGCARAYWFENTEDLIPADIPDDLSKENTFNALKIKAKSEPSYPSFEDFSLTRDNMIGHWDEYDLSMKGLRKDEDNIHKLLGWADPIQGNMTMQCELIKRGYYLGGSWDHVTPKDRQESIDHSAKEWLLLFQLSSFATDSAELYFGDEGSIYFYIHKDDLAERNFDNAWLIMQCY